MKLGFIGLGTMGLPIVQNLISKGFEVYAYDIAKEKMDQAAKSGAKTKYSAKEVGTIADLVLLSLPRREVSLQVCLGKDGILNSMRKGSALIELSTVTPSTVLQIADEAEKFGIEILDAPVSGGRIGAERGELTIMVGGKYETFQKYKKIFESIGKRIFYVGKLGNAEAIKLLNSLMAIGNFVIASEALAIAKSQKLDVRKMHEVINASTGQSWMWSNWVKFLLEGKDTGSTPRIMLKDMEYALEMLESPGRMIPVSSTVHTYISSVIRDEDLDKDASVLFDLSY